VAINGVASLDGKVTMYGKAGPIGSPVDRTLMRNLRANVDAVMIGAGTLRAEKLTLAVPESLARVREVRGLRPQPLAVVATATGNVPLQENLLGFSPDDLLVLVSPDVPEERLAVLSSYASAIEVVPKEATKTSEGVASSGPDTCPRLDLTKALETLKKRYAVGVLLVEGGPALNHALVSAGLADELFLTLAPKLLGSTRLDALTVLEGSATLAQQSPEPELISIHLADSELFLRYALRPTPSASSSRSTTSESTSR
jgi:riboflavin biosynthesis pyrimidine reductase